MVRVAERRLSHGSEEEEEALYVSVDSGVYGLIQHDGGGNTNFKAVRTV